MQSLTGFKSLEKSVNQSWFATSFSLLRIVLGVQFLMAGLDKINDWSAAGYLAGASGPFADFFRSLAGSIIVDQLNIWGLILIGIALILGLLVRPASFFGAILMLLYYFADLEGNIAHGIIDSHIIYVLVFVMFMAGGAGHMFGLDGIIKRQVRKSKTLAAIIFG